MSYLELKGLQKKYTKDGPMIVNDVDLSIEQGEFIVFLGPSGCGKTTIIRMICGLEEVTGGEILIEGESVVNKKPKDRGVSMVFQSYAIWPHMTVYDNIAYPLKLQKLPKNEIKQRVQTAAETTGIETMLKRYPAQMSGGQRQRVAVARAMVVKPKLFLMDEPLSNLDAKLRVTMRTELKNIHLKENSTSIFVTHDQAEAMSLADRIVVLNKGDIEQLGTPLEVYRDSETKFVASFIGTPPTNFYTTTIEEKNGEMYATNSDMSYKVPVSERAALKPYVGKQVDFGVRPEFISAEAEVEKGDSYLCEATVDFVEPQGNYSILIVSLRDQDGNASKVVTSDFTDIPAGKKVSLSVQDERCMFFNIETGKRIR